MGDRMTPLSFEQLLKWIFAEKDANGTVFGLHEPYEAEPQKAYRLFGEKLETPFGPAAGPHTQLAQNLIAAYYAGSRFFELKTVQKLDGDDLPVSKPCIKADDEGYNVEWSTELYVPQAFEEYVKAWIIMHLLAKELGLGAADGMIFNMSVGYDLEGIQTPKIDAFIEGLKDASGTDIFKECIACAKDNIRLFQSVSIKDIEDIPAQICSSITLSTLHGCPPKEIERIADYLLKKKHLHTFIKCNPTLLGYEFARKTLDEMGYDYVSFTDFHFKDDLQYADAVPMLKRLIALAAEEKLEFGVKITNTFPVDIKCGELPGEEMYMSGRALYPLSISLAAKLSEEFAGKLRISYSGGADIHNIVNIVQSGIWPVTMATTVLKPGGYARFRQIAYALAQTETFGSTFEGVQVEKVKELARLAVTDKYHRKPVKPLPNRKFNIDVPLVDCFIAPCEEGCPIHQDITAYMQLVEQEKYKEALELIMSKNPLPFITGTICAHRCMSRCTRNFYEEPVHIRQMKLKAAQNGYESVLAGLQPACTQNERIAIIGGGPAGISAAFFLARSGYDVTMFCNRELAGGTVGAVIPKFRISDEAVKKDISFIEKLGVNIQKKKLITSLEELKEFDRIILAMGAPKPESLSIPGGITVNAVTFLEDFKAADGKMNIGKSIAVIGGGNTAMDTARAALHTEGVEHVSLVYRRTKRYMPADEEELHLAIEDGVEFKELLAPEYLADGMLVCRVMKLGEPDASGRRTPIETDEIEKISADTVIAAVGEKVDTAFYCAAGLEVNEKGLPIVNEKTMESSVSNIYVIGDARRGPATVVEAIADARAAADSIAKASPAKNISAGKKPEQLYTKKGFLCTTGEGTDDGRCLDCGELCENCVDVCPNRANVEIKAAEFDMPQILHIDRLCNECGNCRSFCPYAGAPYQDKFTLFQKEEDFLNSQNQGFVVLCSDKTTIRIRLSDKLLTANGIAGLQEAGVGGELKKLIETVCEKYSYLL